MANLLNAEFELDTSRALKKLTDMDLSLPKAVKTLQSGVRKALGPLKRSAQRNAAAILKNNPHLAKEGINMTVWKNGKGGAVDILPVLVNPTIHRPNGKTYTARVFRLLWIEEGTQAGMGRKGWSRKQTMHGATPAHHFFARTVKQSAEQVNQIYKKEILDLIEKLAAGKND